MAKALHGYLTRTDPRAAQVVVENRRLRQRVTDLEQCVQRLQAENDALSAALAEPLDRGDELVLDESMQPA